MLLTEVSWFCFNVSMLQCRGPKSYAIIGNMMQFMRVCALLLVCSIAPPESIEGFRVAHRALTVSYGNKWRVATMMVDRKIEGVGERNAKLLAQAERLRAEG